MQKSVTSMKVTSISGQTDETNTHGVDYEKNNTHKSTHGAGHTGLRHWCSAHTSLWVHALDLRARHCHGPALGDLMPGGAVHAPAGRTMSPPGHPSMAIAVTPLKNRNRASMVADVVADVQCGIELEEEILEGRIKLYSQNELAPQGRT